MDARALISLRGIVIAAEWGPDGEVTAVDIAGYDENRYRVAKASIERQLCQLSNEAVIVYGRLVIVNQQNVIFVDHYCLDAIDTNPAIRQ